MGGYFSQARKHRPHHASHSKLWRVPCRVVWDRHLGLSNVSLLPKETIVVERQKVLHRARAERYRSRNLANGLCSDCPRPAKKPHLRCKKHHQEANERTKKHTVKMKERGHCSRCHYKLHGQRDEGCTTCMDCREVLPRERRAHLY